MTPERWKQIEKICYSALELTEDQREVFLEKACAGDLGLRREVESLLQSEKSGERFIDEPGLGVAAKMMAHEKPESLIGQQMGSYQIVSLLGRGGMGVVYKARDTRLNRAVAIKVLPADQMSDPERKLRFSQEARAASALNHPNIVTLHDIGNDRGTDFIVMEYVEGKTLDQRIPRKGMKLGEALKIAIQVADALAKAHAAGIVHRDLKPSNVMVTDEGLVKVLDFGLAKLTEVAESGEGLTRTLEHQTEEGTILGTVSYMSPEQAEGKKIDARSDIFSFGSVLYEMTTGQRAFQGDSKMSTLAAILNKDPKPVKELSEAIPYDLEKIVSRCLRKAPERRWQTMADLKVALEELKEESDSGRLAPVAVPKRTRRWGVLAVGLLTLFVVAGLGIWFSRPTSSPPLRPPMVAVPLTSYPGEEGHPTFSPDGDQVAFSWNGEKQDNFDIYVKLIGSGTQLRLTTAPQGDSSPAWSPDGRSIAFLREGTGGKLSVYLVSPLGPPERKVGEIAEGGSLTWTPDGKSLVVTDRNSESEPLGLLLLSVESGEKRRLTSPEQGMLGDKNPTLSSDGHILAFVRDANIGVGDLYLLALSEDFQPIGKPKRLTFENRVTDKPVWTSDSRELVFSSGILLSQNLFRVVANGSGKPQRLAGVGEDGSGAAISPRAQRLVYTRELVDTNIWRHDVPDRNGKTSPPRQLVSSTRIDISADLSLDGKRIVFVSNRTGSHEIWVCDSDGSNAVQLTSLGGDCGSPHWSPDGEHIAFDSTVEGQWEIYLTSSNGGKPKRFTDNLAGDHSPSWSRDGKWIYFSSNRSGEKQVWKMPARGGEAIQVTRKGGLVPLESPDGRWIYYTKHFFESPLWKMAREGGEETQVLESVVLGNFAVAKEGVFFVPRSNSPYRYSLQFLDFATKKIRPIATIDKPVGLLLSVSPDGSWILSTEADQVGSDLMLVENFQ